MTTTAQRVRPFRFAIPAPRPYFRLGAGAGSAQAPLPGYDPEREAIRRKRCRVLVVDDEDGFRAGLCAKLKRSYQAVVIDASGPRAALREVKANPDLQLVLLDISMPDMDGVAVCEQMRASGVTARIVLMSAQADAHRTRTAALNVRLLAKPLDDHELRQVLLECGKGAP